MEDYLDKGYLLYMDNFYNSVDLIKLLSVQKTLHVEETTEKNPKDLMGFKKLKKRGVEW